MHFFFFLHIKKTINTKTYIRPNKTTNPKLCHAHTTIFRTIQSDTYLYIFYTYSVDRKWYTVCIPWSRAHKPVLSTSARCAALLFAFFDAASSRNRLRAQSISVVAPQFAFFHVPITEYVQLVSKFVSSGSSQSSQFRTSVLSSSEALPAAPELARRSSKRREEEGGGGGGGPGVMLQSMLRPVGPLGCFTGMRMHSSEFLSPRVSTTRAAPIRWRTKKIGTGGGPRGCLETVEDQGVAERNGLQRLSGTDLQSQAPSSKGPEEEEGEKENEEDLSPRTGLSAWLYPPAEELPDEKEMTIFDHLEELRERLLVAVAAVGVAILGCFVFAKDLIVLLERPVYSLGVRFLALSPGEYFFTTLKVKEEQQLFPSSLLARHPQLQTHPQPTKSRNNKSSCRMRKQERDTLTLISFVLCSWSLCICVVFSHQVSG